MVDGYARRLQVQERLTTQIASALETVLEPIGAVVVLEAEHLRVSIRGVAKPGALTITSDDHLGGQRAVARRLAR